MFFEVPGESKFRYNTSQNWSQNEVRTLERFKHQLGGRFETVRGFHLGTIWVQFRWNFVSFGTMSANFTVIIEETVRVTRFRSALSVSRAYPGLHAPPGIQNWWKMVEKPKLFFICLLEVIFNEFWYKMRAKIASKSHAKPHQKQYHNSICF